MGKPTTGHNRKWEWATTLEHLLHLLRDHPLLIGPRPHSKRHPPEEKTIKATHRPACRKTGHKSHHRVGKNCVMLYIINLLRNSPAIGACVVMHITFCSETLLETRFSGVLNSEKKMFCSCRGASSQSESKVEFSNTIWRVIQQYQIWAASQGLKCELSLCVWDIKSSLHWQLPKLMSLETLSANCMFTSAVDEGSH